MTSPSLGFTFPCNTCGRDIEALYFTAPVVRNECGSCFLDRTAVTPYARELIRKAREYREEDEEGTA